MLLYSWVIAHFLIFVSACRRQISSVLMGVSFAILLVVYGYKADTYDLPLYLTYFSTLDEKLFGHAVEPAFGIISNLLANAGAGAQLILFFWQAIIFICLFLSVKIISNKSNIFYSVILVASSLFFLMASQNALRQGVSLSLLFLGLAFFLRKNRFLALIFCVLSYFVHRYVLLFFGLSLFFIFISNNFIHKNIKYNKILLCSAALLSGACLGVYTVLHGGVYGDVGIDWGDFRTSPAIKFIAILFLFLVTNYLLNKKALNSMQQWLVDFRLFMLFVLMPLAFVGEIFSRVAVFYFLIESVLMVTLFLNKEVGNRLAGGVIVLAYGLAPNALNIIATVPRQWLGFN